jgi:hypothetical protein
VTKRNGALRVEVEEKSQRMIKRVDELIAQIDQVDVQLQSPEETQ